MVGYHIDMSNMFQQQMEGLPLGGKLSARRPLGVPVLVFVGQEKAIFKQFLLQTKMWWDPVVNNHCCPRMKVWVS